MTMPGPSRWLIRLSLIYLLAGIITGALMLIHKAYPLHPAVWMLLPIHIEIVLFGWIIQFTMGTGYWMLPRYLAGPPRGREFLAWAMTGAFNLGIMVVLASRVGALPDLAAIAGRTLEILAVVLFIALHWNRIVTYRRKT